jgi:hypothetical protein
MTALKVKRPEDRSDYDVWFGRWMSPGDVITSIVVTISAGTTIVLDGQDFTADTVKVWVKGGVDGETATITVEAKTLQGREKEICFKVCVRTRC